MAILTASGRAALAAAIKEQTLYLALGEGDPLWDTIKAISTPFDEAGVIELGFTHLADIRVTTLDDQIEYLLDVDYSVNAREGVIRRLPDSSIPEQGDVTAHFKVAHPPEPIGQTALLREVGHPIAVAGRYGPHTALIGPEIYPFWLFGVKVLLAVALIVGTGLTASAITAIPEQVPSVAATVYVVGTAGLTTKLPVLLTELSGNQL